MCSTAGNNHRKFLVLQILKDQGQLQFSSPSRARLGLLPRLNPQKPPVTRHRDCVGDRHAVVCESLIKISGGLRLEGYHRVVSLSLNHESIHSEIHDRVAVVESIGHRTDYHVLLTSSAVACELRLRE